jgi:GAF domain-containing protein
VACVDSQGFHQRIICVAAMGLPAVDPAIRTLLEATSSLVSSVELSEVLKKVLQLAEVLLGADAYAVWRRRPEALQWHVLYSRGLSEDYTRQTIEGTPANYHPTAPILVENIEHKSLVSHRVDLYHAEGIRSFAAYPLTTSSGAVGTVTFYFRQPKKFDAGVVQIGQLLANVSNAAINTAELFETQTRLRAEAQFAAERAEFLSKASTLLASSLDYSAALNSLAQLAVPKLADWCSVSLIETPGKMERVAVAHADPARLAMAREYNKKFPPDIAAPGGVGEVLRSGKPMLVAEVTDALLRSAIRNNEQYQALTEIGMKSVLIVPLISRDSALGALTLVTAESGRVLTPADLELAQALATRAAVAIDNARLYHAMSVATGEAQLRQEELRIVQQAAKVVSWSFDPETQIFSFLSEETGRLLGVEGSVNSMSFEALSARLFFSTDRHKFREAFDRLEKGKKELDIELRVGTKRGAVNLLAMRGKLFFNQGRSKVLGVLIDLSGTRAEKTTRRKISSSA